MCSLNSSWITFNKEYLHCIKLFFLDEGLGNISKKVLKIWCGYKNILFDWYTSVLKIKIIELLKIFIRISVYINLYIIYMMNSYRDLTYDN